MEFFRIFYLSDCVIYAGAASIEQMYSHATKSIYH